MRTPLPRAIISHLTVVCERKTADKISVSLAGRILSLLSIGLGPFGAVG